MTVEQRKQLIYSNFKSLASFARAIREPRQRVNDVLNGTRATKRIQDKIANRLKIEARELFGN